MTKLMLVCTNVVATAVLAAAPAQAVEPSARCEAAKLKMAARYNACRLNAQSKALAKGEPADFGKCDAKFVEKWQAADAKAGAGVCPTEGDAESIHARLLAHSGNVITRLSGEPLVGGARWFLGEAGQSCDDVCSTYGYEYDPATGTYAGSSGTRENCRAVMDALTPPPADDCFTSWQTDVTDFPGGYGLGCIWSRISSCPDYSWWYADRDTGSETTGSASMQGVARVCACQ